jgi:formate/nitrite transporter FocA (FNT family)
MFVIPAGMMSGAKVSLADWWLWNQIPVTLGNVAGGLIFTGLALYATHKKALAEQPSPLLMMSKSVQLPAGKIE